MSFRSLLFWGYRFFFFYGCSKTSWDIPKYNLQLFPENNNRVIASIVQNAFYHYSSLTVWGKDLKPLLMCSVNLVVPSIYSYRKGRGPLSAVNAWKFLDFVKNKYKFWTLHCRANRPLPVNMTARSNVKVKQKITCFRFWLFF